MNKQKNLWEKLAKENSRYYIYTSKGRGITEKQFKESGKEDYKLYILADQMIDSWDSILEIGCGIGRMTEFMAKDFQRVIGIDISGEMIKQAKERLKQYPNVELLETDGEKIPLVDNSVEITFSYLVFQHIKSREMVEVNFKEVYRVLKPKGLFKVRLRTDRLEDMESWWSGVYYNGELVDDLCRKTGFRLLNIEEVGNYAIWLWLEK